MLNNTRKVSFDQLLEAGQRYIYQKPASSVTPSQLLIQADTLKFLSLLVFKQYFGYYRNNEWPVFCDELVFEELLSEIDKRNIHHNIAKAIISYVNDLSSEI